MTHIAGANDGSYRPNELVDPELQEVFLKDTIKGENPYDRNQDGLYEAKHQCMIKNNVIILKNAELENLKLYLHK